MMVLFALLVAIPSTSIVTPATSIATPATSITTPATSDEIKNAEHLIIESLSPLARPLESGFDFGQVWEQENI